MTKEICYYCKGARVLTCPRCNGTSREDGYPCSVCVGDIAFEQHWDTVASLGHDVPEHAKHQVALRPGQVKCPVCNGTGFAERP